MKKLILKPKYISIYFWNAQSVPEMSVRTCTNITFLKVPLLNVSPCTGHSCFPFSPPFQKLTAILICLVFQINLQTFSLNGQRVNILGWESDHLFIALFYNPVK